MRQDIVDAPAAWRHPGLLARLRSGGVLVLSAFHRRGLPRAARPLAVLTSNGLDASHLTPGPNPPHRFMYAAWPTAGLQPLLELRVHGVVHIESLFARAEHGHVSLRAVGGRAWVHDLLRTF